MSRAQNHIVQGRAGEDLSALKNTFVFADTADNEDIKSLTTATSNDCLGVLINDPADTEDAFVVTEGITYVVAGEVFPPFAKLTTGAGGKAFAVTPFDTSGGDWGSLAERVYAEYQPLDEGDTLLVDSTTNELVRVYVYPNKTGVQAF